jgi:prepilin-type N-terminal cleavage/methylation domain-containing protein
MIKSERGFTLVELVMVTALTGLIASFLGTSIYQMLTVTEDGNGRLTALHELQNAAYWFQRDGQAAVSAAGGSTLVLTLAEENTITYDLNATDLRRNADGEPMIIARNITTASFTVTDRVITMSLTSAPEGRGDISESATYQVHLRPAEEEM